ncbi:MAG TPA: gamma carbonic anhydrase family protein [Planktothrix sp.]|jgi:carbonic anhydrase/acetyltransferase-like protein (isoleucine patch superfamily)
MIFPYENFRPEIHETVFVAPTAVIIGRTKIAEGASIWFNCVVRGDINAIEIGKNTNIQDGCLLHVTNRNPLVVAERVTVGHGAILHGCRIEADCLVSMGAVVLDGAAVGAGSVIAAGAVVTPGTVIPPNSLVMGVPGKIVRNVTPDDCSKIERGWQNYLRYSGIYQGMGLKPSGLE